MWEAFVVFFLWLLFGGSHIVLSSSSVRPQLIAKVGARPFQGIYSLVALATFIPLVWYYGNHKHSGIQLWHSFLGLDLIAKDLNVLLMALAFILLVSGLIARPPSSILASGIPEAYGVTRITRHPTFAAFFLFGIAHCLMNGTLTDLVFFGGFSVFAWIGAAHQDSRKVIDVPGYATFKDQTSFIPFAAILDKRQPLNVGELRWIVVVIALVIFYIVRAHHPGWFGGARMIF
jgi:uncharacterized membrane protein